MKRYFKRLWQVLMSKDTDLELDLFITNFYVARKRRRAELEIISLKRIIKTMKEEKEKEC